MIRRIVLLIAMLAKMAAYSTLYAEPLLDLFPSDTVSDEDEAKLEQLLKDAREEGKAFESVTEVELKGFSDSVSTDAVI